MFTWRRMFLKIQKASVNIVWNCFFLFIHYFGMYDTVSFWALFWLYIYLLNICYEIQNFCIPDMNRCTSSLSHPLYLTSFITLLYHIPFWNTSVFFMRITSRFFHLNAHDSNVINGVKIRRFGVFGLTVKLLHCMWGNKLYA